MKDPEPDPDDYRFDMLIPPPVDPLEEIDSPVEEGGRQFPLGFRRRSQGS